MAGVSDADGTAPLSTIVSVRALGVSVANGVMHLACLTTPQAYSDLLGSPVSPARRIVPSDGLDAAHRVTDLRDRFAQDVRSFDANGIGLVSTRLFAGLTYRAALKRITAMSASMIAATELGLQYTEVKTEEIAKLVGVLPKSLKTTPYQLFGFAVAPMYWTSGLAEAYGAAAVLLQGSASTS